ncbi:transcription factor SRM1-like [Lycium barbarum]|uniref:transcription factor SRM1-like n=1 Tax=Lycium barbarum TaxID=112863 RepID=UPI00293EF0C8|nr:transcription factor SRM1-like [Lycium barbarum]
MSILTSVVWSKEEEIAFENAIALHCIDDSKEQWENIALMVPSKTTEELKRHYQLLVDDVTAIEYGYVPIPNYTVGHGYSRVSGWQSNGNGLGGTAQYQERRKGMPWTEEEHRLFLLGLNTYGKGDWRSISRNFVISRTPSQVASHAQKYFNRLYSNNSGRRRSSIHDITI